jgi:S1-C subfamily serine protease
LAGESLRVVAGNASGKEIQLENEFLIGRAADTDDGKLGDDPEISRNHARISRRAGDQLAIEDLGSTNGTFVNGKRLEGAQVLNPGDTVKVGTTTLQVQGPAGEAPQATAFSPSQPAPGQATKATPTPTPPPPPAPTPPPSAQPPSAPPPPPPPPGRPPAAPPPGGPPTAAPGGPPTAPMPAGQAGPPPGAPPRPGPPGGAPPPPPSAQRGGRGGGGFPVVPAVIGGLVLIGIIVVAVVVLAGGGGDEDETLTTKEIINQNQRTVARVDTRTPGFEDGKKVSQAGGGTGIVIDAAKGHVVTNQHVIAGATSVKVTIGQTEANARVLGQAPCEDLAVLELTPKPAGLKAAQLGAANSVASGDEVVAMGFPGSFEAEATQRRLQGTEGTVSSGVAPGTIDPSLPKYPALIQHAAPISPGNSGGPLFNNKGEVVGINTLASTGTSQNQNGAISISRARSLFPDLQAGRDSAYLGWNLTVLDASEINSATGARPEVSEKQPVVVSVDADSPAEKAKLVTADTVNEVDGTPVSNYADICDILSSKSSGDRVSISGGTVLVGGIFLSRYYDYTVRARLK